MKRYLAAGGAAALVLGAVIGSASALNINDAGVVQAGQKMGVRCDTNGVKVNGYFLETNTPKHPQSYGVVVSDIASACFGKTIVVRALNGNGNQLPGAYGYTKINDNTMKVHYLNGGHVSAKRIQGVQITIG